MSEEVRVIKPEQRDRGTAQTPGMLRAEGTGIRTVGAEHLWVGHVTMEKGVKSGPHHHGEEESSIYIVSGRARFRFGERLENVVEAEAGDFIFVPPMLVHQEINASDSEPIEMVVSRSGGENISINVALPDGAQEA
jgi:uncharacterized RmlC-like cupin family protein